MRNLRNKVVVITGASSGFGRGAAVRFAEQGANVVLAARRKNLLKEVADECRRRGVRAEVVEADVSDHDDVETIFNKAMRAFGRIDVWVNNAGVAAYGEFNRVPLEDHEQVIRTDVLGTLYGSYLAMQQFRKQRQGVLINIGSYLSKGSAPYHASYVAAKHAVRGLGMSLRQDLEAGGMRDIHVCTVMPTSHDTPFFGHAANYTGKPVRPTKPFYDPERTIDTIVGLATDPQAEVMVGTSAKVASVAGKLMPERLEKRMAKKVRDEHFGQEEDAPTNSGAIFEPMESGDDVYGGWEEKEHGSKLKTLAIAGVVAPMAAMALAKIVKRARKPQLEAA